MLHYFIEIDHIVAKYYLGPTLVPPADVSPPLLLLFLPTLVPHGHISAIFGQINAAVSPPYYCY